MSGTGIRAIAQNTHLPFFYLLEDVEASQWLGVSLCRKQRGAFEGFCKLPCPAKFPGKINYVCFFSALSYKQKLFAHSKLFFFFLRVTKQKSVVEFLLKKNHLKLLGE